MMRVARWLVGSIVVTALLAGPALAQGYPPGAQTIEVSDSTVFPSTRSRSPARTSSRAPRSGSRSTVR